MDLGVIAMKGYSTFSKAPELESHHQTQFSIISRTLIAGWDYLSAEMQPAYSKTRGDGAENISFNDIYTLGNNIKLRC